MAATNDLVPDFDDFERYYSGEMPSAEQRSLEGRMLAEPLVAEAYEGFLAWRGRNASAATAHADLHERLHTRVAHARRTTLPLWAHASAASVLLAVFSYWFAFLRDQKEDMQKPSVTIKKESATSSPPEQAPASVPNRQDKPLEPVASAPAAPKASKLAESVAASRPEQPSQALPKSEIAQESSVLADTEVPEKAADIASKDSFKAEREIVQVLPQPAKALATPGSLQTIGKSMADRARKKQKDVDTQYLVVSKPVFAEKETYSIVVPADTLAAAPSAGWPSYQAYLDKNTGTASTTGQIMVTFIISSSGALSGFLARGPEELQKEAIRIISNGPAWAPARTKGMPVSSMAEIRLQFRKVQ